jgi:hypothetical protein
MSLAKVEGFSQFQKDTTNGGVVNVDARSYAAYKRSKTIALQKNQEHMNMSEQVSSLESEINIMKNDLTDIKNILVKLLEKGN